MLFIMTVKLTYYYNVSFEDSFWSTSDRGYVK